MLPTVEELEAALVILRETWGDDLPASDHAIAVAVEQIALPILRGDYPTVEVLVKVTPQGEEFVLRAGGRPQAGWYYLVHVPKEER